MEGKGIWFEPKMMFTIAWNSLGFHAVDVFPKAKLFNATHDIERTLESILIFRPKFWRCSRVIRADSFNTHTVRRSQIFYDSDYLRITSRPRYSSDLASSDFYLFEHLKHYLAEFLSFERGSSSRNSHNFEEDITDYFEGRVQELDESTDLGSHARSSLLFLK
jgi:hypothetical protein